MRRRQAERLGTASEIRTFRRVKANDDRRWLCLNGIVLCADTQETLVGYTKGSTEKIRVWKDNGIGIAIAGAGDSEAIEAVADLIKDGIMAEYLKESAPPWVTLLSTRVATRGNAVTLGVDDRSRPTSHQIKPS